MKAFGKPLFTMEIGSLAKPAWRVKAHLGEPVDAADLAEARLWGERLGIGGYGALLEALRAPDSPGRRRAALEWSAIYALRLLESAGLDFVFDGEQWRREMYEHAISAIGGFAFLGEVRSFDNKYYRKAACIDRPWRAGPIYLEEFLFAKSMARRPLKVPVTGAYTLADWSFDEYYRRAWMARARGPRAIREGAKRDMVLDLAREVLRPELRDLAGAGAEWIQIDEPAATTHPSEWEMELFVEAFNESASGLPCRVSLHNCYSDYSLLARYAPELRGCWQISLEFANRDSRRPGTSDADRPGYRALRAFEEAGYRGSYGLGVLDVHTDFVEPPELVRDRILYALGVVGWDPGRIQPCPDCGLRTRTWEVALAKLGALVEGARLAREAIGCEGGL